MIKVKLSDLANIKMGQSPQGETCNENGNGIPLLNGPSEFTSFYPIPKQYTNDPKKLCQESDILFCVRGSTTGRMNWADKKYAIGRGLASISHKKGNNFNHFLKYLIEYNLDSILNLTSGSTFPNLTNDNLASYEFYVPEIEVQKKISFFLRSIDSKIELNNKINAELEAMAKTLYDYWFVQFDFPDINGKPYKSSGGKMVCNEELKRDIPEGWDVKELFNLLTIKYGKDHKKLNKGLIPVYGSGGIMRYVDTSLYNNEAILIPRKGSIGNLFYISEPFWSVDTMFYSIPIIDGSALYYFYQLSKLKLETLNVGTTIPSLTTEVLNKIKLLVPNADIMLKFNLIASKNQKKSLILNKQNQELASLRDWLLPMLMNGQVSVRKIDQKGEKHVY